MPVKRDIDVIFCIDGEPITLKLKSMLVGIHDLKIMY